ncbi:MAG: thioredoxin-like domain-containing protein [Spirochaetes bacterium]|nr:thioredoxin-like domain-containing protein [Spirochaetota bacterium]
MIILLPRMMKLGQLAGIGVVLFFLFTIGVFAFGKKESPQSSPPSSSTGSSTESPSKENPMPPTAKRSWAGTYPAPEFPEGMEWLNVKEPLRFSTLKGKIVLLDFWTYGCINCIHNLPDLKRLQEEFPNELVVIGIHSAKFSNEGRMQNLRNILLRYEITHPVVNDPEFLLWQMWGPRAWPTLVLVDPAGNVSAATMGEGFYPQFKEIILSLREEFASKGLLDTRPWRAVLKPETRKPTLLSFPGKVRVHPTVDRIVLSDTGNHRILIVEESTGRVLDRVGGPAAGFSNGSFEQARFRFPQGIAFSIDGKTIYVADTGNHAIRMIDLSSRRVTTLVGTGKQSQEYPPAPGIGSSVALSSPWDVEVEGQTLFIAMAGSHQIWKMDLSTQAVSPLAGSGAEGYLDGAGKDAELAQPSGLSLGADRRLYFADSEGSSIRYVDLSTKDLQVVTLAGSGKSLFEFGPEDGVGPNARFQHPLGVRVHQGKIYVADTYNHRIREIDPQTRVVRTLSGLDPGFKDGQDARWDEPGGLDAKGNKLYVVDTNNHALRIFDLNEGRVSTLILKDSWSAREGARGSLSPLTVGPFPGSDLLFNETLPPLRFSKREISPGRIELSLWVDLPKGYKVTSEAFSTVAVRLSEGKGRFLGASPLSMQAPTFPIRLSFEFAPGFTEVHLETAIAYCAEGGEGLCYIDRRRLEVPLEVKVGGKDELALRYPVVLSP